VTVLIGCSWVSTDVVRDVAPPVTYHDCLRCDLQINSDSRNSSASLLGLMAKIKV
jgi:hypothetical protein